MKASEDPSLLSAFHQYLQEINIFRVRIACVLGFTFVPLFSLIDYVTAPRHFETFLVIRLVCTFLTLCLFLFSFTPLGRRHINFVGGAAAILIGGTISMIIRYLGGYESSYYAGLNLVILAIATLFAWELRITAGICLAIYGFYIVPILLYDNIQHPEVLINNNAFLLTTLIIALTGSHFLSRLRYQEFESRYKLEESRRELQISNEKLKELDHLKARFFADISHELRTPLAVVRGEAEVTLRGEEKPITEYKRVLNYIVQLTDQINKLVADLLFLARSQSGMIELEKKKVALHEIVREASRQGGVLAEKKSIKVSCEEVEDTYILGDKQRLIQLLLILLDNAVKYTDSGGTITISLVRAQGYLPRVIITDTGIGISEKDLPHIFDRFYRGEKPPSMARGGAGLGLAIAKWITTSHNGQIQVASTVGKGTTVTLHLPPIETEDTE